MIGNGGRENALAWALKGCNGIEKVWVTPGNGGTENHKGCKRLYLEDQNEKTLIESCFLHSIDLIVIGPEAPLAAGLADKLRKAGLVVFGPGANGAQLEASKSWAKDLMKEAKIPTANYWTATTEKEALSILQHVKCPLVVKADGLASGKGVTVPDSIEATAEAIKETFQGKFGKAGAHVVLEEKLQGPEVSVFALCDGKKFILLPPAQDHKRLLEDDKGPNTGGMGAYAPAPLLSKEDLKKVVKSVLEPTLSTLNKRGINYRGVIYAGLMMTSLGPQVIEFNCRFGDPECQTLMPLMGPELARILQACALGCLEKAPKLTISNQCSACVVSAAKGYPHNPRKDDLISLEITSGDLLQIFQAGTYCDEKGMLFTSGGRVLSVVAQGNNFDDAFTAVYKGLSKVHFDGMIFRKDIGHQVRQS